MPGPLIIGPFGGPEIAVIGVLVILLFGVGRISGLGRDLGSSIREFRRAVKEDDEEEEGTVQEVQAQAQTEPPPQQVPPQQAVPPPPADSAPRSDSGSRSVF